MRVFAVVDESLTIGRRRIGKSWLARVKNHQRGWSEISCQYYEPDEEDGRVCSVG
jgi:hypothetical protein